MNMLKLLCSTFFCVALTHSLQAESQDSRNEFQISANSNAQSSEPDPKWYCDHFPGDCIEVCQYSGSPWGPFKVCKLRPNWYSIPDSNNPYLDVGATHNEALKVIGTRASFDGLDERANATHMIQHTAEYLCETEPDYSFTQVDKECVQNTAGFANEVFDELRSASYLDGTVEEISAAYIAAFRSQGILNQEQLAALETLFAIFPSDDNVEELPYIFERIDDFDRYTAGQMTEKDSAVVLQVSSVLRASAQYWLLQLEGPSDWITFEGEDVEMAKGIFKKILKIIAADAGGCGLGALVGGVVGCAIGAVGLSAGQGANW